MFGDRHGTDDFYFLFPSWILRGNAAGDIIHSDTKLFFIGFIVLIYM
jgi:hypothetical protein